MDNGFAHSDINRLLKVLNFQEADRVPHHEFWVTSRAVYEYALGRAVVYEGDVAKGELSIAPEDHVAFAARIGMDSVSCNFSWRPGNVFRLATDGTRHYIDGAIKGWDDLKDPDKWESPPDLGEQLRLYERYLQAAEGTGVGVFPNFTSFFDSTQLAMGYEFFLLQFYDNPDLVHHIMDLFLANQARAMEEVCRQYKNEIPFVFVNDDIGHNSGLAVGPKIFRPLFEERMRRLIAPAKAIGKLCVFHTDGKMDEILPILYDVGFNAIHPVEPESNDIYALKKQWYGKMAIFGNVHTVLLAYGTGAEIERDVREHLEQLGPGGGYVLGSSTSIMDGIPPENFLAMVETVHRYGAYQGLGAKG